MKYLICILIFLIPLIAYSQQYNGHIKPDGETFLNSGKIRIEIISKVAQSDDYFCKDLKRTCSFIEIIKISFGNEPVFVPKSVYRDLIDVNTAELKDFNGNEVLFLTGGDASEGYKAYVIFNSKKVISRRRESAEFPKNLWEETNYINRPIDPNL